MQTNPETLTRKHLTRKHIAIIVAFVAAMIALPLAYAFGTGITFGQRCAAKGFKSGSNQFDGCVHNLARGHSVEAPPARKNREELNALFSRQSG